MNRFYGALTCCLYLLTSPLSAQILYQTDDGTSERELGVPMATTEWGNMFAVSDMGPILNNVSVGIGFDGSGTSIRGNNVEWRISGDDDGDPTAGLVELASGTSQILNINYTETGIANVFEVPNVDISGFPFVLISMRYEDDPVDGQGFISAQDTSADLMNSWAIQPGDGPGDFSNGSQIAGFGFPGPWIIRGNDDVAANSLLAHYDDDSGALNSPDPLPNVFAAAGISSSDVTQVGLAAFANENTWPVGTWGATFEPNQYVSLTITPDEGNTIDFSRALWRHGFFNPTGGGVRTSLDGFSTDVSAPIFPTGITNVTNFDLSSLSGITEEIELRFYFTGDNVFSDVGTSGNQSGIQIVGAVSGGFVLGDVNCDGVVDLLDVEPFVDLLTTNEFDPKADINEDDSVDLLDVQPFVDLLTGI